MDKIIVTLPGFSAEDQNIDPKDCSVHSDYTSPKIPPTIYTPTFSAYLNNITQSNNGYNYGWVDFTFASNPPLATQYELITIPHKFGYIPATLGFKKDFTFNPPSFTGLPTYINYDAEQGELFIFCNADSQNLHIVLDRNGTSADLTGTHYIIKWYIFAENGS